MIKLSDNLAMTADEHCYIVGKPRQERGKGIRLDFPTYHATAAQAVQNAVSRAMRDGVQDGSITTLREFIDRQKELQAEFKKLVEPLEYAPKPAKTRTSTV